MSKKTTVVCKLEGMEGEGELRFLVWPRERHLYIPEGMVAGYRKIKNRYAVKLTLPKVALEALKGEGGWIIWDRVNDMPVRTEHDDFFDNAADRRAALYWLIYVRGGITLRKRAPASR